MPPPRASVLETGSVVAPARDDGRTGGGCRGSVAADGGPDEDAEAEAEARFRAEEAELAARGLARRQRRRSLGLRCGARRRTRAPAQRDAFERMAQAIRFSGAGARAGRADDVRR